MKSSNSAEESAAGRGKMAAGIRTDCRPRTNQMSWRNSVAVLQSNHLPTWQFGDGDDDEGRNRCLLLVWPSCWCLLGCWRRPTGRRSLANSWYRATDLGFGWPEDNDNWTRCAIQGLTFSSVLNLNSCSLDGFLTDVAVWRARQASFVSRCSNFFGRHDENSLWKEERNGRSQHTLALGYVRVLPSRRSSNELRTQTIELGPRLDQ